MKIKKILITQPKPDTDKSPYFDLAAKYNLQIDFKEFTHIEPVRAKEVRKARINILDYSAVIFTGRTAVDHFFRISKEMRIIVPDEMKYFCLSESIAYYLQKYVIFRKRKIFYANQKFSDLIPLINKYKNGGKILFPCSDIHNEEYTDILDKNKIPYKKAVFYRTVPSKIDDLKSIDYDIIAFFTPAGIISLFQNTPKFKQNKIKIATFGSSTLKVAKKYGLKVHIVVPKPNIPSMSMALEQYIKKIN